MIDWRPIRGNDIELDKHNRVMVFSPAYPDGHEMRYRVLDSQFVRIVGEATHWAPLTPPADAQEV